MATELKRITKRPRKVRKTENSVQLSVPPVFFLVAGIDPDEPAQVEMFAQGKDLLVRFSPLDDSSGNGT